MIKWAEYFRENGVEKQPNHGCSSKPTTYYDSMLWETSNSSVPTLFSILYIHLWKRLERETSESICLNLKVYKSSKNNFFLSVTENKVLSGRRVNESAILSNFGLCLSDCKDYIKLFALSSLNKRKSSFFQSTLLMNSLLFSFWTNLCERLWVNWLIK